MAAFETMVFLGALLYCNTKETQITKKVKTEKSVLVEKNSDGSIKQPTTEDNTIQQIIEESQSTVDYFTVLSNPRYSGFCFFIVSFMFTHMSTLVHIQNVSYEKGMSKHNVIVTLQSVAVCDIITIPLSGYFLDAVGSTRRTVNMYLVLCFMYAVHLFIVVQLEASAHVMMVAWIIAGIYGTIGHMQAVNICSHLVPISHIPIGVGVLRFFQSIGVLLGPYLTGM